MFTLFKGLRHRFLSRQPLTDGTDIFVADPRMEDHSQTEACMMENDKFVGATASFDKDGNIIPLREDLYPIKYSRRIDDVNCVVLNLLSTVGKRLYLQMPDRCATLACWIEKATYIQERPFLCR